MNRRFAVQSTMAKFSLLEIFFYYVLLTSIGTVASTKPMVVNIGVILSFNSSIGEVAKVAIEAAVDDVNASPIVLHGTKLRVAMQDTKLSSGFLGIIEALRFMENDTMAIIGPQYSVMAHVISHIANELQVPLLSFAATDPTLNSLQFPYFVRTTQSDLYQMAAVAEIIGYYKWQDVIAIYIDDDHGRNGVVALGDKLAEKHCKISYKAPMSPIEKEVNISQTLYKVAMQESQVIILFTYPNLGLEVVDVARKMGLMKSGYVWIATDWLPTLLDTSSSLSSTIMDNIQGVLTLRMHTPDSEFKRKFLSRWNNLIAKKANDSIFRLNTYGLYAYDTVWLLAHAFDAYFIHRENISFSNDKNLIEFHGKNLHFDTMNVFDGGNVLLGNILQVNMIGLSGPIKFNLDRDLVNPTYEVINIIGSGIRTIGYWSNASGLSIAYPKEHNIEQNSSSSNPQLHGVIWPGQVTQKPYGWVFMSNGKQLESKIDQVTMNLSLGPKVLTSLLVTALMYLMLQKNCCHMLSHISLFHLRVEHTPIFYTRSQLENWMVDLTQPYIESGLVVVAPIKKLHSSAWAFLRPFTPMMWCVIGLFFLMMGVVVWILERRTNDDFQGPPRKQFVTIIWFSFSTLFSSHREKTVSTLGRFVLIIWLFVVLIINSSYIASLTSILTVEQLSFPINGIESLKTINDPIGFFRGSFSENYLTKELNIHRSRLVPLDSPEEYEKALKDGPHNGGVAAMVDERVYMELFLSTRCEFGIVGQQFTTMGWGFAFPRDSQLAVDMSAAILTLSENGDLQRLHNKWLARSACSSEGAKQDIDRLKLKSFWGFLLLCGSTFFLALVFYLIKMLREYKRHIGQTLESPQIRSFLSFIKEKENVVNGVEEGNSRFKRRRRERSLD